jgi:molybdenum cofactor synthesis domain-containing protein
VARSSRTLSAAGATVEPMADNMRDRYEDAEGALVTPSLPDAQVSGRALVVIVDDRTAHGDNPDATGPLVTELLTENGFLVDATVLVANDEVEIRNALNTAVIGGVDLVISVGGTGVSPRDVAPDATREVLDRELDGIAEALRASGLAAGILDAGLSRGLAGVSGSTLVVNLAGSRPAVRDGMTTLAPLARYVIGRLSALSELD